MSLSIGETTQRLHHALRDYIEATYHISDPMLVAQRRALLDQQGVIHQRPFLESTPRYQPGKRFKDLGLPDSVLQVFRAVATPSGELGRLIYDPPYDHQSQALQLSLSDGRNLVVMTGTGSGKTECFLLPILGKLAIESERERSRFASTHAVRAMVLYPMNALVNDQLGRLRLLLGDPRVVQMFQQWSGRPPRFARYTSRTLYPGVRSREKDQARLKPLKTFYVDKQESASGVESVQQREAADLILELRRRGKWPAKPDISGWYGSQGEHWQGADGAFKRCVTLPNDSELITRHEVQAQPPDVLVTNYSMLEYMLMRPLERPIFDCTRDWLEANPAEKFLLVIDEAHLYRGAQGAEVAMLIRRLRQRLGIPADRLQVICTSASFNSPDYALEFGAALTGKDPTDFEKVQGKLLEREHAAKGSAADAAKLNSVDLDAFHAATTDDARTKSVAEFLAYRGVEQGPTLQRTLYSALEAFGPLSLLVNATMKEARPVDELKDLIFEPDVPTDVATKAVTTLTALGSIARRDPSEPGLLPCRIHSFYRGLAGLWVCMDPDCPCVSVDMRGGPTGKLYSQPRDACECGARVLELYTCRNCGSAYARAYTNNVSEPDFLWAEPGRQFDTSAGKIDPLVPVDLLLEQPTFAELADLKEFDLVTGRLNPRKPSDRIRRVYIRTDQPGQDREDGEDEDSQDVSDGIFCPCAVCNAPSAGKRPPVQDHQTKGDQPFQAIISRQIEVQPPSPVAATRRAPLRGRKVLVFSDSRQMAARLAPNIENYSNQDVIRPLVVVGWQQLENLLGDQAGLTLDDVYPSVLIASHVLDVRLRPVLKAGETFGDELTVREEGEKGNLTSDRTVLGLLRRLRQPPESLMRGIANVLLDRYYGLESLALASLKEADGLGELTERLPDLQELAVTREQKLAAVRMWLRLWTRGGLSLASFPPAWRNLEQRFRPTTGRFKKQVNKVLPSGPARRTFNNEWLPVLLNTFCEQVTRTLFYLKGDKVGLEVGGAWAYCRICKSTQRPFPGREVCVYCGKNTARQLNPEADRAFSARKSYYRASTIAALRGESPIALIAGEHSAALGKANDDDAFSKTEENELLFQDVDVLDKRGREQPAIDVLSCTTTMEVGIDIGSLSGVALRNMPPARSNYQQRAGRAGRRGNAVATVTAFGSADSHDEHFFSRPEEMIRGAVIDPHLNLDNYDIIRRHVTAYLLQRYHQEKLPNIPPDEQPQLFSVLGTVTNFKRTDTVLNRADLEQWLESNKLKLCDEVTSWVPSELCTAERERLLTKLVEETLEPIDAAVDLEGNVAEAAITAAGPAVSASDAEVSEIPGQTGEERSAIDPATDKLLDRLLYCGVLPRYAFPTDVATFHVFDPEESDAYRPVFRYTPSQALPVALSQYAPGKEIWVDKQLWTSDAIYSPIRGDRYRAWEKRRFYYECSICHYAVTAGLDEGTRRETKNCDGCGGQGTLGPATLWLRPPGFAHQIRKPAGTTLDDSPPPSYATRAKLTAPTPADASKWSSVSARIKMHHTRDHLLVTNRGPRDEGYTYCTLCGLIEPTASPTATVSAAHPVPYPIADAQQTCPGNRSTKGLVLGTDFITDVLLVSLRVAAPLVLKPGLLATEVALRSICEAVTKAACRELELEPNELEAEYRPALTNDGRDGLEAEIFIYDTLPGGAGFARRVGEAGLSIFESALHILEHCPDGCDRSCYRCLRSYTNKFDHDVLDRHLGASLLRYVLYDTPPVLSPDRITRATQLLYEDLERQGIESLTLQRTMPTNVPGIGPITAPILATKSNGDRFVIGLAGPLTPGEPLDPQLKEPMEVSTLPVLLEDELIVWRALPVATKRLIDRLA